MDDFEILPQAADHPAQIGVEVRVGQEAVDARRIDPPARVAESQTLGNVMVESDSQVVPDRVQVQLHEAQNLAYRFLGIAGRR